MVVERQSSWKLEDGFAEACGHGGGVLQRHAGHMLNPASPSGLTAPELPTKHLGRKLKAALKEQLRMIHEKIEAKKIANMALAEVRKVMAREEAKRQQALEAEEKRLEQKRLEAALKAQEAKFRDEKELQEKREKLRKETLEKESLEKEKAEKERLEKERLEKERLEKERLEKERLEKERQEKAEKERLEKERQEKERLQKAEKERLERERLEDRLEKERQEKERLQKAEKERLEKERLEERLEKERLEKVEKEKLEERLAKDKAEKERLEKERAEKERLAKEKAEKESQEKERLEKEKAEKEKQENERLAKEKAEKERLEKEKAEKEKQENERLAKEKAEKERLEKEKAEKEEQENERLAKEKAEKERLEKEKAEKEEQENERLAKEKAEKERLEKEKAEKEKQENEKLAKEKAEKERLEKEKLEERRAREKVRLEKERLAKEKDRLEKERLAKENAEKERTEKKAEKESLERLEKEKAEKEKLAKEKEEKGRAAKQNLESEKGFKEKERLGKDQVEKEKLKKEKERLEKERERLEKERLAKEQAAKERGENTERERLAKEKERAIEEKEERERSAKEKAVKERLEKEQAAKERAEKERAALEKERMEGEQMVKENAAIVQVERQTKEKTRKEATSKEKAEEKMVWVERVVREERKINPEESQRPNKDGGDSGPTKERRLGLKQRPVSVNQPADPRQRTEEREKSHGEEPKAGTNKVSVQDDVPELTGEDYDAAVPPSEEEFVPDDSTKHSVLDEHPYEDKLNTIDTKGELVEESQPQETQDVSGPYDNLSGSQYIQKPVSEPESDMEPSFEPQPQGEQEAASEPQAEPAESTGSVSEQPEEKLIGKVKKKKPKLLNKFDKTIKAEIEAADRLRKKGFAEEAIQAFEALVQRYPHSPRCRYGKAQAEDDMAEKQRSNEMLQKAINTYREASELPNATPDLIKTSLKRRAERQHFLGRMRGALATLEKLVQIFPEDLSLKNDLGVSHLLLGDNNSARRVYEEVLAVAPDNGFAKVHYGFILKSENKIAESIPYLREGLESGDPGTDDGRFYFHLGDALQRVGDHSAYEWYERGHQRGHFASVWQRSLYNVKGLRAQPWWTAQETGYTDLIKALEKNWRVIRDEALSVMDTSTGLFLPEEENLREKGEWGQFTLWQQGKKAGEACRSVPRTCSLLERYPEATGCKRGQIKFSVMQPGTHVWPHTGPTNCRLRMHLGLVIPKQGSKIRCTNDTRVWEEGKVLIFDDSFEHEVWQDSDSYRLIFIIDVWHPELSQHQRQMLSPI